LESTGEAGQKYLLLLKDLIALEEQNELEEIRSTFVDLSAAEREARGKALLNMVLREKHFSPAAHVLATFARENQKPLPLFSLEPGDLIRLMPYSLPIEEYPSGTVYEKTKETITVAFSQELPEWLEEGFVCHLLRAVNRSNYERMDRTLEDVISSDRDEELGRLRDISFGLKKPESAEIDVPEWFDPGLNDAQKKAVLTALAAQDVALLHGPPGTGKTRALVEIIRQCLSGGKNVFVTAPSNTACDNLLERLVERGVNALRLGHPARITTALREHTLDFKLALHPDAEAIIEEEAALAHLEKRQERYHTRRSPGPAAERELRAEIGTIRQRVKSLKKELFDRVMKETEVIVGTPVSVFDRTLREKHFDVVIFDEATQSIEPMAWIPLSRTRKTIMAGDHFQLPPTVRSKEAEAKGLGKTLFERFYERLEPRFKTLLNVQYRMNDKIMGFSSKVFYEGLLIADESVKNRVLCDLKGVLKTPETESPFLFIDTAGKGFEESLEEGSESRYNLEEANLVLGELKKMLDAKVPANEIAVISPYSAQVRLLTSLCPDPAVEIDSVDGFQGREKELVLVSLVRSNVQGELGFLTDTRRMNVALTRARRKLIAVGDSATLSSIPFYKNLIEYADSIGGYASAWSL